MTLQKFSLIGSFFIFIICLYSCTKDKIEIVENNCPDEVSYSLQVKQIIDETCAYSGCHDGRGNAPGDFTTYNRMQSYLNEDQFGVRTIDLRDMPPNYASGPKSLTQEQLDMLLCWIENEYKD